MNLNAQEYLAKLLANEDITVRRGQFETASFDVVNRVLNLPIWKDRGKDVNDLMIGHEVGHALYTPVEGWHDCEEEIPGVPRSLINIIEDIRIEAKIQETYPGIVRAFTKGYKVLFEDGFFGPESKFANYNFADRLNIHAKGRSLSTVEFSAEEMPYLNMAMNVKTWEDVLAAAKAIAEFMDVKKSEEEDDMKGEDESGDNGAANDGAGESDSGAPSDSEGKTEDKKEAKDEVSEGEGEKAEIEETTKSAGDDYSETEEIFRAKYKEMQFDQTDDERPVYFNGISKKHVKEIVIRYEELHEQRTAERCHDFYTNNKANEEFVDFMKSNKRKVQAMVREFERKKAAYEYSRTQTAKKGSIDVNRIHQYQYSEDIFQTVEHLAQAKSHGVVAMIDWSGSMMDIFGDVIKQAITLSEFCKAVNIPFEFYTFTTRDRYSKKEIELEPGDFYNLGQIKIVEVLSSRLNKHTLSQAQRELFAVSFKHSRWYISSGEPCAADNFGGTPFIESALVMNHLIKAFNRRTGVQKTNMFWLTDGDAQAIEVKDSYLGYKDKAIINVDGELVEFDHGNTKLIADGIVDTIRKQTGCKNIHLFLAPGNYEFKHGLNRVTGTAYENYHQTKKEIKEFRKTGIKPFYNVCGYDLFAIIKVGDKDQDDTFTVKDKKNGEAATLADIKRQFKNFSSTKRHEKKFVHVLTQEVAA